MTKKKIETFEKINNLQNIVTDIKNDNDSILKKIKNKFTSFKRAFSSSSIESENVLLEEDIPTIQLSQVQEEKLKTKLFEIKEQIININEEINGLHIESKQKKYVDIYIIFKNPTISNHIYKIYNKSKVIRFFYYFYMSML